MNRLKNPICVYNTQIYVYIYIHTHEMSIFYFDMNFFKHRVSKIQIKKKKKIMFRITNDESIYKLQ